MLLYIVVVLLRASPEFFGDEGGYVAYASRIVGHPIGEYQPLRLWWGPGYPLVLAPFAALGGWWTAAKVLNALLLFGAIAYLGAAVRLFLSDKGALIVSLCAGLYPPFLLDIHRLSTETLTIFLVCGFAYHFCAMYSSRDSSGHRIAATLFFAYLALTKVFFAYANAAATVILVAVALLGPCRGKAMKALRVSLFSFICCVPYLAYTYSVTGKLFYWGTSGGMSLYWMSTPYPDEWGSWFSEADVRQQERLSPHRPFFDEIRGMGDVERDEAFRRRAVHNIVHNPKKFLINWIANMGRLLFSYPFSLGAHSLSTYFYIVPNMFIVVLFTLSIVPALCGRSAIPFEIWAIVVFALISFAGSSVLSAYSRQFRPILPMLCLWLSFIYLRVLKIELAPDR